VLPLVGVVLGITGTLMTNDIADRRAQRQRAQELMARVTQGVSSFQTELAAFHERRTSARAKVQAGAEAAFGVIASLKEGNFLRGLADEYRHVRRWDLTEADRFLGRFQASLADLFPALMLLGLMDQGMAQPANNLARQVHAYASAMGDPARLAVAGNDISAALAELGNAVRAFVARRWWNRWKWSKKSK
jgi:hypothetical protein